MQDLGIAQTGRWVDNGKIPEKMLGSEPFGKRHGWGTASVRLEAAISRTGSAAWKTLRTDSTQTPQPMAFSDQENGDGIWQTVKAPMVQYAHWDGQCV